jgi:sugar phosphate isomerase/epimerase
MVDRSGSKSGEVLIGTIALEVNRWAKRDAKRPSFAVSEWTGRFREAGFDGMELWQFHATRCAPGEVERLAATGFPTRVFNIYTTMTAAERPELAECTNLAARIGVAGIKYNVGPDPARRKEYLDELRRWRAELPAGIAPLCECHPGTVIEEPEAARRFFDELGGEDWEIIVHPFSRFESLAEWLRLFGPAVRHAHLQMRDADDKMVGFGERPDLAREAIGMMRAAGYRGSWALEFTAGTARPSERIDALWRAALEDFGFLRELLA